MADSVTEPAPAPEGDGEEAVASGSAPTPDPDAAASSSPGSAADAAPAPASAAAARPVVTDPAPAASPPTSHRSPYDHLLRVRGDVGGTSAIAIFLAGATAFLVLWSLLTAGGPDPRAAELTLGDDARAALPAEVQAETPVWIEGYTQAEGEQALGEDEFRLHAGAPVTLELPKGAAGATIKVGYDLGHDPIVSNFLLPKPTDVMAGIVELVTGAAYQARCGASSCVGGDPIALSASDGEALEAYRNDPQQNAAPDVKCPRCGNPLAGTALAIPTSAQGFRGGIRSTLWRTTLGFLVAAAVCVPLAVLAGSFPPIKRFISPLEIAGGYAPPVALLPLAAAASGFLVNSQLARPVVAENTARIGFLFVVIAFWLYPLIVKEIEAVDQVFVNTAYTLGARRGQVVLNVLVPVASGKVWEHLRATYAIGWASIILAEGYASSKIPGEYGIGFFMTEMQRRHNMVNYFAAVLAIIAVGIVIDWLFRLVGKRLFPWQEAR